MTGREVPPGSPFAGDDGSPDPQMAGVLQRFAAGEVPVVDVVAALAGQRVLVPVLAELLAEGTIMFRDAAGTEREHLVDKEAASGVVAVTTPDGRRALPVFTSVAAMVDWSKQARPVPVTCERAALAAVSEEWAHLVVDPAGPVTVVIPRPAVWALAQGKPWVPAVSGGHVAPDIVEELQRVISPIPSVSGLDVVAGSHAEVAIELRLEPGLDRQGLQWVLGQVNRAVAGSSLVGERVDSVELHVGAAR